MQKFTKIMALTLGLTLFAAACGDDSGGGGNAASADDPLVQAIVDDIMADGEDGLTGDRAEAECFVGRVVGDLGDARLTELGVTPDNVADLDELGLTEAEASAVVDNLFDCIDVRTSFTEELAVDGMTDEQTTCLANAFDEDTLKGFFVAQFTGSEPENLFATLTGAMNECGIDPLAG